MPSKNQYEILNSFILRGTIMYKIRSKPDIFPNEPPLKKTILLENQFHAVSEGLNIDLII